MHTPETRKKISIALVGNKNGLGRKMSHEAIEKIRKWHIGKKHSTATREKISRNRKGKMLGSSHPNWKGGMKETKECERCQKLFTAWKYQHRKYCSRICRVKSRDMRREKNPDWKGENVKYSGIHMWIRKNKTPTNICEHCGKTKNRMAWANKDHKYSRNLNDWIRLCPKCHKKYDKEHNRK
ncbi:MAG: NUMOD3 domain-containing DNA-binding protein [Patescibacteria group bacterium]